MLQMISQRSLFLPYGGDVKAIKVGELMVENSHQFVCDFSDLQAGCLRRYYFGEVIGKWSHGSVWKAAAYDSKQDGHGWPPASSVDQFRSNSKSSNPKQNSYMGPYKIPASLLMQKPVHPSDHENRESSAAILISLEHCCWSKSSLSNCKDCAVSESQVLIYVYSLVRLGMGFDLKIKSGSEDRVNEILKCKCLLIVITFSGSLWDIYS